MESYYSIYSQGLARVAACTLPVHPAQPLKNARDIVEAATKKHDVSFPPPYVNIQDVWFNAD